MADIDYPASLPDFRITKQRSEQQTYRTTSPFSGPLFIEPITDESPVTWDITVTCTSKGQSRIFKQFLKQKVPNGELFNKDILVESGHVAHEVRFISMPLEPRQLSPFLFEYSGTIMARALINPDDDFPFDLIEKWIEDASLIDVIVNDTWALA